MEILAPAKVNLCLNVCAKRPDGYHEIETVFEKISIYDHLTVNLTRGKTAISSNDPSIPTGDDSLMMKAIKAFKERTGKRLEYEVFLEKNIPVSAGLGGGSSDTASLLKALNELSGAEMEVTDMVHIAKTLGADIPFFLYEAKYAFAEGVGEVLRPIDSGLIMWHVLACPPFGVATKGIYEGVDPLCLTKKGVVDKIFGTFLEKRDIKSIAENLRNDLQCITLENFPILKDVFPAFEEAGSMGTLVSGSGPVIFGIFESEGSSVKAKEYLSDLLPDDWKIVLAKTG